MQFSQGFCLSVMEISGYTAGTTAQENWNSFPIAKSFFFFFPNNFGEKRGTWNVIVHHSYKTRNLKSKLVILLLTFRTFSSFVLVHYTSHIAWPTGSNYVWWKCSVADTCWNSRDWWQLRGAEMHNSSLSWNILISMEDVSTQLIRAKISNIKLSKALYNWDIWTCLC